MTELTAVTNNIVENLPTIIAALAALVVAWTKLEQVRVVAQTSVDKTVEGNTAIADANEALADHAEKLEVVRHDVNSGTIRATDAAKLAADESKRIAVQIATLQAEKTAALKASELAKVERDSAMQARADSAAREADLKEQLRLANARNDRSGPTEVIVANVDPVLVREVVAGDGSPPSGTH